MIPTVRRSRGKLFREIRGFFASEEYLEVDTPALAPSIVPEPEIEIFETQYRSDSVGSTLYLLPSPERYLKRLVAAGERRLYQLSHSYRNGEQTGANHLCEFMMLEWYCGGQNYMAALETCERLLRRVYAEVADREFLRPVRLRVNEAFSNYAGIDLDRCETIADFRHRLISAGIEFGADESWSELFHRVIVGVIEPAIAALPAVVLFDYPNAIDTLARKVNGHCERWELYLNGKEVANCYSEEIAPNLVASFIEQGARRMTDLHRSETIDSDIARLYDESTEAFAGVALGVDRLLMDLLDLASIEEVTYFGSDLL